MSSGASSPLTKQHQTGLSPQVKLPERKKDLEKEQIKVLVNHNYFGSHLKNSQEIIEFLLSVKREDGTNVYDVTAFTWQGNHDLDEIEGVNIIRHYSEQIYTTKDFYYIDNLYLAIFQGMVNERKLYEILSDEGIEIARQLKAVDADVFLFEGKDFDIHLAKYLEKPGMAQHFYMP